MACSFDHYWSLVDWASLISSVGKESACNAGDLDSIPRLGRSPGEGKVVNEARFLGWGRGSWKLWGVCLLLQLGLVWGPAFPIKVWVLPDKKSYWFISFSHSQVSTLTWHQHRVKTKPGSPALQADSLPSSGMRWELTPVSAWVEWTSKLFVIRLTP